MTELKIRLPAPTPVQRKILAKSSRFNAVCMGEEGGKTTLGIEVLIATPRGAINGKAPVAWFSATKDELADVRRTIKRAIDPLIKRQANARRLELVNGNHIDFYSLDEMPNAFPQYGLIVVDNVRKHQNFLLAFEDVLSETLREHEGEAWFLSGAYGKRNDFYRLYQKGLMDPDWSCWQFDSFSNPHLSDELKAEARTVPELEYRQRFGAEFLEVAIELTSAQKVIRPNETFRQWCERLAQDGLKVDGKPFKLDDRPAMAWIYDQVPSNADEAYRLVLVLMKCAQVGFTVMEMLATIYLGLKFGPATVGMFLPDTNLADIKSSKRFMPVVRTIPSVHKLMTMEAADGSGKKSGEGNVRVRQIGEAMFVFSWTSGRATTESIPMDILSYDEVQEMTLEQMEKTQERLSASDIRFTLMGSTANWPDSDIHHWYKRGSQYRFHTECPTCGSKKPLDDYFPDCIKMNQETGRYQYVCPNGHPLEDTQLGEWLPDNPDADVPIDISIPKKERPLRIRSIHFPQFLSPTISAEEIIFAFNNATDMKNFYNRKLGKPYLDPSQVPVTLEHLANCEKAGMAAGVKWKTRATGTFMGIDQMGNFNVHVIKERLPDGRQAVIHVEETYSEDPFLRSSELMEQYGVAVCVVEINPNYNDAKKFAQRHPGKVFICNSFGSIVEGMIHWGDTPKMDSSDRRTSEEAQDRYTLKMDQYKCMQVSMSRFTSEVPSCVFPDRQGLAQEVLEKGKRFVTAILPRVFHHFTKTALVAEKDDETNQYRRSVKKIGIDPHFSYANMLCDVAWSRAHGTSTFILPDAGKPDRKALEPNEIGVPDEIAAVMEQLQYSRDEVCGNCASCNVETKMCNEHGYQVRLADPGCWQFIAKG
ncbi:terminase [Pseudomonas phage Dolphis]|nr:terminase [Pseudomonas phage Dolphis]